MENLRSLIIPIIDNALRIIGVSAVVVIAGFLIWWLWL